MVCILKKMADVAREAGVSLSTVSHVLNGTRKISATTEEAVRNAIEAIGYVPNRIARSLATGKGTRTIGVAMTGISDPYFSSILQGIEKKVSDNGYLMLLVETNDNPEKENQAVQALISRQVDGIILAPSSDPSQALKNILNARIPAVIIDRIIEADFDQVGCHNIEPTAMLVRHLVEIGHEQIAMISPKPGLTTTKERIEGFILAHKQLGLVLNNLYLVSGGGVELEAKNVFMELMSRQNPPTAVIVGNNFMTIGVLRGMRELGLKIPRDVAIVTFDDFEWADLFHPRMTAISQPVSEISICAASMLLDRIVSPAGKKKVVRLTPTFRHRESCGCK